jgi:hypothetical protein
MSSVAGARSFRRRKNWVAESQNPKVSSSLESLKAPGGWFVVPSLFKREVVVDG